MIYVKTAIKILTLVALTIFIFAVKCVAKALGGLHHVAPRR